MTGKSRTPLEPPAGSEIESRPLQPVRSAQRRCTSLPKKATALKLEENVSLFQAADEKPGDVEEKGDRGPHHPGGRIIGNEILDRIPRKVVQDIADERIGSERAEHADFDAQHVGQDVKQAVKRQ